MNKPQVKLKLGALYIRESTEGQDLGYSPKKQENDIKEYAKKHNIDIVAEYKDLVSGTEASKRIDFQKMLVDAQEKKFEIVLVFHTSRFARNVKEARKYKEFLREELKIDVVSVTQDFGDWNDPSSYLNEGINELFDAYYSKQLSFWMRKACAEKRTQGYCLGNPPLGYYKKKGNSKDWFVQEDEAKIIKDIFKKYSTGKYSMADLAKYLNDKDYKTKLGNVFTHTSLKDILQNVAYTGYISSKQKDIPPMKGKHPIIINQNLFDKVRKAVDERRNSYGRPVAPYRFYLLQGLVYCYHCYKHIKGKEDATSHDLKPKMYCHAQIDKKKNEINHYSCKYRRENKSCKQPAVKCDIIDKQVLKYMENFSLSEDLIQKVLVSISKLFDNYKEESPEKTAVKNLLNKRRKINFKYDNTNELTDEEYLKQIKDIEFQLEKYQELGIVDDNYKTKKKEVLKGTEILLRDFKQFWNLDLTPEEKQNWIQLTIKRVWVKNKKVVAIEPRDEYKAMFSTIKVMGRSPSLAQIG